MKPRMELVKASAFEPMGIPRLEIYKMARLGLIPHYRVGARRAGIRFVIEEVLDALKHRAMK
jgi:hypothetical protein